MAAAWDEMLVPLGVPKCGDLDQLSRHRITQLINNCDERRSIEWWRETFKRASRSKWLLGSKFFSFAWLLKSPQNIPKLANGFYDDHRFSRNRATGGSVDDTRDINEILGEIGMPGIVGGDMPVIDEVEGVIDDG